MMDTERKSPDATQITRRLWHNPEIEESLLFCDLAVTEAHVRMLGETSIIDRQSMQVVLGGLNKIHEELRHGKSYLGPEDLDIHSALERSLRDRIGDIAGVVHIAISRNDQIATDIRVWLRDAARELFGHIVDLRTRLIELALRDLDIVMPGYTHMQPAQPILLSHWWLANESRFKRDYDRLSEFYKRLNVLPLGACVLAGTKEPIDRIMVAKFLRFDDVIENSLDAVSDRDFLIEFGSFASLVGLHLSQMASDLLLWSTQEFGFIRLQKRFVFASPHLPMKRNPELLEILRSRPSTFYGRLMEFITQLKGVPSGFSQDLQECLPGLLDVVENLKTLTQLATALLNGIDIDAKRMREVACADLLNGSNAEEYLVSHGVEPEKAQKVVEQVSHYSKTRNKYLSDLALSEWQQFSPAFEADIYEYVTMEESVGAFCSFGGSSKDQVELALERAKSSLQADSDNLPRLTAAAAQQAGANA